MPTVYTVPDNIAYHAGPLMIGIVLNWWLYGVLCVQYYLYLTQEREDRKTIKWIVHIIFLLDSVQTLMMMEDVFYWYVYNFGNIDALNEFHLSAINMVLIDAIIAFIVQLVYCWRIYTLSRWKIIPFFLLLCMLLAFGSGIFIGAADITFPTEIAFRESYRIGVYLWLIPSAGVDVLIAGFTGYLLLKMNRRRTSKALGKRLIRILTLTLESNAITAIVALEIIIVYFHKPVAPPATKIYLPGGYVLGKLYSNCFMILLNQRHNYKENETVEFITMSGDYNPSRPGVTDNLSAISFAPNDTSLSTTLGQEGSGKSGRDSL